jgi:hypothetical protein
MTWFSDAIDAYMRDTKLGESELARRLGVARQTLNAWRGGRMPEEPRQVEMLTKMGGDIRRAFPAERVSGPMPAMSILGTVQAGSSTMTLQEVETHTDLNFLWQRSSGWVHSKGPVSYIRVTGDSMDPVYPEGCIVAVREPVSMELPKSTPVVFLDLATQSSTLKLFQRRTIRGKDAIFGVPINPRHDAMIWSPKDVRIQFVVLGKAEPMSGREIRQNAGSMIMRENAPKKE